MLTPEERLETGKEYLNLLLTPAGYGHFKEVIRIPIEMPDSCLAWFCFGMGLVFILERFL